MGFSCSKNAAAAFYRRVLMHKLGYILYQLNAQAAGLKQPEAGATKRPVAYSPWLVSSQI
jgi:hypothetical protein